MQGKSVPKVPIMNEKIVGDETILKIVEKIKNDKRIKGVIIRVNSPGGDAFASLRIWNSLNSLKEKKPVLISFGDISASGGYLISSIGSKILSDKTTLTGSIGIFMGKFSMGGLYKKLGIKKDYVKWGEHADVFSDTRRFDEYELKRIEKILRENYEDFTSRVSKSRGIPVDSVEKLGEGRVWSGRDAKNIGLVDANGGLLDAIEEMKRILNIKGKVGILIYPQNIGVIDIIEKSLNPELRSFDENNLYYYEPLKIYVK
jgi:protease-4